MKKAVILLLLSACLALTGCSLSSQSTRVPIKTTTTPSITQSDLYVIRVTGSKTVVDREKYDRILEQQNAESDAEFEFQYAKGTELYNEYVASGKQQEFISALVNKYMPLLEECYSKIPSVAFAGSYMSISSNGSSSSRSVDGTTPVEYSVRGSIISCSFQKQSESGTLTVEIIHDGKVITTEYTTADYGVVSVATR